MEITMKDFVSTEAKIECVGLTIQEAFLEGIVNPMLLDAFFAVNLVLTFTDVSVEDEEKTDKLALYDKFISDGTLTEFLSKMGGSSDEIEYLRQSLKEWSKEYQTQMNSFNGLIDKLKLFAGDLVNKTDKNLSTFKDLDINSLKELVPLAKSLGFNIGGNETPTEVKE